jgi:histidinol-phosphate aminotransferase
MSHYFQPHVARMAGYEPGEQPRDGGYIKLNTNENPYPPSHKVAEAIGCALYDAAKLVAAFKPSTRLEDAMTSAVGEGLRKYPDPVGTAFRATAARHHGVTPEMILPGNGSDDLLTIITRAFAGPGDLILATTPSYILYHTLAQIQNARFGAVPFRDDWSLDFAGFKNTGAKLAFLANPNSPSGTVLSKQDVQSIATALDCPLVVDEAYADFAASDCVDLVRDHPNVIVTRSFSKGYSLAGLRLGYLIARPELVEGLIKVKDTYNCNTLSLLGGASALEDQTHFRETRAKILATRARLAAAVLALGFSVPESHANFVWCTGHADAQGIYESLKAQKILVRLMKYPGHEPGLRITVGTDLEIDRLLEALRVLA